MKLNVIIKILDGWEVKLKELVLEKEKVMFVSKLDELYEVYIRFILNVKSSEVFFIGWRKNEIKFYLVFVGYYFNDW